MGNACTNCGDEFGWDLEWEDAPEGEGYIEVSWNPEDEPSFVVGETRRYCSVECLDENVDETPFGGSE